MLSVLLLALLMGAIGQPVKIHGRLKVVGETCSVLKTSASSTVGKEGDLKESGGKIREYLRGYPAVTGH